jgi:hypothetical protein
MPAPVYIKYAGVGFITVLYVAKLFVSRKKVCLSKINLWVTKTGKKDGTHAPPSEKNSHSVFSRKHMTAGLVMDDNKKWANGGLVVIIRNKFYCL